MSENFSRQWYYIETVAEFLQEARDGKCVKEKLIDAHKHHLKEEPPRGQKHAWEYSTDALAELLESAKLRGDQIIVLEARLRARRRIDALLCGKDESERMNALVLELKRWNPTNGFDLQEYNDKKNRVLTVRPKKDPKALLHPCIQVEWYKNALLNVLGNDGVQDPAVLSSYVYFHNCEEFLPKSWQRILDDPKFNDSSYRPGLQRPRDRNPIYTYNRMQNLAGTIGKRIGFGSGISFTERLRRLLPVKPLAET